MTWKSRQRVSSSKTKQNKKQETKHTKASGWINVVPEEALMVAEWPHDRKPADGGQSCVSLPRGTGQAREPSHPSELPASPFRIRPNGSLHVVQDESEDCLRD